MIIGIPKEIMHGEKRVSATPETVQKFITDGAAVSWRKARAKALFTKTSNTRQPGAKLISDVAEIYSQAESS